MHRSPTPRRALGLAALAIAALVAGQSLPAHAADSVRFQFHYRVGQHYAELQVSTSTQKYSMTAQGIAQPIAQNQTTVDRFVVSIRVIKVYPDGSADGKITFSGTHSEGTKTVTVPLSHYYRIQRVAMNGQTLSTKTFGANTVPADLLDSIPDTQTEKFPSTPIAVGGTWDYSRTIAPFGTLTLHNTLVAVSMHNGHPVATIHASLSQKASISSQGLTFSGMFTGSQDAATYADTFGSASPTHSRYSFAGKISGKVNGTAVKGTFSFSGTEVDTPQS